MSCFENSKKNWFLVDGVIILTLLLKIKFDGNDNRRLEIQLELLEYTQKILFHYPLHMLLDRLRVDN